MADIDLKTETPDTSLPTTGFLFGADSQASASPSVYSTQTVATTLLGSTSLTGATITTSQPVLDLSQTWNASGVTFTGLRFNAAGSSDANSAAGSLLMDLQRGTATQFSVRKDGAVYTSNSIVAMGSSGGGPIFISTLAGSVGYNMASNLGVGWTNSATSAISAPDLLLTRRGAANLRLGAADAAAPVAQTLSVQSVVAGTSNTAGQPFTITGSQGTGNAAGGSIIFQVAPAGSSGTAQNALVSTWQITGAGHLTLATDNTYDIGAISANRPRDICVGSTIYVGGSAAVVITTNDIVASSSGTHSFRNRGGMRANSDGVFSVSNNAGTDFNRFQFGGTTSSFPALKRNGATLETRLADDSGFAAHGVEWISVTDGVTAPAAVAGRARIYVDTTDGDLKVIFGDGTIKTIVTDT